LWASSQFDSQLFTGRRVTGSRKTETFVTDGGRKTREVGMKKLIVIITLCALQAACAGQQPVPADDGVLLSYQELATEITVGLQALSVEENDGPIDETRRGTL
jgi:hypothetical protein